MGWIYKKRAGSKHCAAIVADLIADLGNGIWGRSGGGKSADERLVEARKILAENYGFTQKTLKTIASDWAAVEAWATTEADRMLKATGQKYVKANVEYGQGKVLEALNASIDAVLAKRSDGLGDFDMNDWK